MPELIVRIVGDASSLQKSYASAQKSTAGFARSMERSGRGAVAATVGFKGLGRAVGYASGAFLGGAGLAAAAKAAFGEMAAGQKVAAQTRAALRSTGGQAGVTAQQIQQLAGRIQQYSGFDDEAVQSAENLLLTFTRVRNEAGKGNDVFTQTTRAAADMSRAFGQDLSASALQLGKALNDPVQGVGALRRVGISFSADQVKVIDRLEKTGHILDAQKIILREVTREVGGSARAYGQTLPGQLDILKGSLQNIGGEIATTLAPQLEQLTKRFNKWLENPENKRKVMDSFATGIRGIGDAARYTADTLSALKAAWDKIPNVADLKHKGLLDLPGGRSSLIQLLGGPQIFGAGGVLGPAKNKQAGSLAGLQKMLAPPSDVFNLGLPAGYSPTITPAAAAAAARRAGATVAQRNAWFDAMIGRQELRAGYLPTLRKQITAWKEVAGLLTDQIAITKDITRKQKLTDELLSAQAQIRQLTIDRENKLSAREQAAVDKRKRAAEKAAEATRKEREAAKASAQTAAARVAAINKAAIKQQQTIAAFSNRVRAQQRAAEQAKVFALLGLSPTGDERTPSRGNLQTALKKAQQAIAGTPVDTKAMESRLTKLRSVINTEFTKLNRDTRIKVQEFLDALAGKDTSGRAHTKAVAANLNQLIAGTGLHGARLRRLELNLAGAHLTTVPRGVPKIENHLHITLDGKQVEHTVTVRQKKQARRTPYQTRGRVQ